MTERQTPSRKRVSGRDDPRLSGDPRIARTRATLTQALMQLLRKKDWGDISITSLCRHAGIARSSFYEHFKAKADLLDELFAEEVDGIAISDQAGTSLGTLDWLVNHASEAPGFFSQAMSGRRGDAIGPRFVAALINRLEQELAARAIPDAGAKAAYVIGGSIAYLLTAKDDKPCAQLQQWATHVLL